ncbi:MAG: DoxX family protein [Muribaculaceae bacterium]|nr:DoxX family protein [Muribaculaceae bacterium]
MKIQDTISVNPGKTALGHTEDYTSAIFRTQVVNKEAASHKIDLVSFLFPSTAAGFTGLKNYALPLRALFATILIVAGLSSMATLGGFHAMGLGIVEIVFGGLLAIGVLTRPVMFGAAIFFAIYSALSVRTGHADISSLSLMFGCFIFSAMGSGKYSVDLLLRKSVKKAIKHSKIKKANSAMGYKALHYAK